MPVILGVDPGSTTGWCLYDSERAKVLLAGSFKEHFQPPDWPLHLGHVFDYAAVEKPVGYGPTYPQVVAAAYVCGRLVEHMRMQCIGWRELEHRDVCRRLTEATDGCVRVRNDATAWAALLLLHGGEGAAKKGGPLHGIKSHSRAALAVAYASIIAHEQHPAAARPAGDADRVAGS